MKKLMIAAAAVMVGIVAQATAIDWSVGTLYEAPEAGGWAFDKMLGASTEGYTVQFFCYTDAAMTQALDLGEGGDITSDWYYGMAEVQTEDTAFVADDVKKLYGKVIVTNDKGQTLESNAFMWTPAKVDDTTYPVAGATVDDIGGTVFQLDGSEFTSEYGVFKEAGWSAVPEPTSGLLLLLGVGALALRRRRA